MKMKTKNLFPMIKPNPSFREQLKFEILEMYNQQRQPHFNWRWFISPGVAFVSLLLVVLIGNEKLFSQLPSIMKSNQPELIQPDIPIQSTSQVQEDKDGQPSKLIEAPLNLEQLDQELAELSDILNTDIDLEEAINFNSL